MSDLRVPVNIHIQADIDLMRVLNLALQANPGAVIEGAAEIQRVVVTSPEGAQGPSIDTLQKQVVDLTQENVNLRIELNRYRKDFVPDASESGPPAEFCPP